MNASDYAALEIGRLHMRAIAAETQLAAVQQENADLKAQVKEFTNGVEKDKKPVRRRKPAEASP